MIPFIGEHYPHKSRAVASNLLVNCYTETVGDTNAKSKFIVIGSEGTGVWSDLGDLGGIRGSHRTQSGELYRVYGNSLVKINQDKTFSVVYAISDLTTFVSMADNGYYLMIADGVNLWAFDLILQTMQEVTPDDFTNPSFVKYHNQRFYAINKDPTKQFGADQVPNNNKIYFSEVGPTGCLTWLNLSYIVTESSADANIAIESVANAVWVFGQSSYEIFQTSANPDAPLAVIGGASGEIGCLAPYSVAKIGGSVFWLGASKAGRNQIYMSQGLQPVEISNSAISDQIDKMGDTSDAVGFTYKNGNHTFYVLTFIGGNKTFVYDVGEGNWSRRTTRERLTNVENRWAVLFADSVFSTILCGINSTEKVNSLVVELDSYKYDDWDGRPIINTVQGPHMWSNLKRVMIKMIKVDMQVGLIPQTGQGSAPTLDVSISEDGYVFNYTRTIELPLIGQYKGQVIIPRCGSAHSPVIRIRNSDNVPFVLMGVDMKAEVTSAY
jgi:hypothetical protein